MPTMEQRRTATHDTPVRCRACRAFFKKKTAFYMELAVELQPRQGATDVGFELFPCDMELG
jgi:hypothetical protein